MWCFYSTPQWRFTQNWGWSLEQAVEFYEKKYPIRIFSGTNANLSNSTFVGAINVFNNGSFFGNDKIKLYKSEFVNCIDVFQYGSRVKVDECRFDRCARIGVKLAKGSEILNCQFNQCVLQLLSTQIYGGIKIDACEFNGWKSDKTPRSYRIESMLSMLCFSRAGDKDGDRSSVSNCSFNNIDANQEFLISGDIWEKMKISPTVVMIDNCKFNNCSTKRESKKVIKEYATYENFIGKDVRLKVVDVRSNCKGLDFINAGRAVSITPKTHTGTGQSIGSNTKVENVGVPGYVSPSV